MTLLQFLHLHQAAFFFSSNYEIWTPPPPLPPKPMFWSRTLTFPATTILEIKKLPAFLSFPVHLIARLLSSNANAPIKPVIYSIIAISWAIAIVIPCIRPCFLPPANVVCEGYVFTGVCLSTVGGGLPLIPGRMVWQTPPGRHLSGRRSTSEWYGSCWNAFLYYFCCTTMNDLFLAL